MVGGAVVNQVGGAAGGGRGCSEPGRRGCWWWEGLLLGVGRSAAPLINCLLVWLSR